MYFKSHVTPEQLVLINLRKERADLKARVERLEEFINTKRRSFTPAYQSFLEAQRGAMRAYLVALDARISYHEGDLNE